MAQTVFASSWPWFMNSSRCLWSKTCSKKRSQKVRYITHSVAVCVMDTVTVYSISDPVQADQWCWPTWLFWFPRQKFCRNWCASLINSFILTSSFPSKGICSRSRTTCRRGVKLNMVIIPALGNVINVTTSIRNISLLPADLVHSHVAEQPLLVFPRLERSSKARLYAHSIHPVENLLDSFIIAGLKGNNLVYCEDELTNRAPAASGCHMSKTSIAGRASHYWGHQTWTDLDRPGHWPGLAPAEVQYQDRWRILVFAVGGDLWAPPWREEFSLFPPPHHQPAIRKWITNNVGILRPK